MHTGRLKQQQTQRAAASYPQAKLTSTTHYACDKRNKGLMN